MRGRGRERGVVMETDEGGGEGGERERKEMERGIGTERGMMEGGEEGEEGKEGEWESDRGGERQIEMKRGREEGGRR